MYEIFLELLKKHNVTVADVCKATGISHSTMSNWKNRRSNLNTKHAQLVADFFGVSVQYLLTGEEAPPKQDVRETRLLMYFKRLNEYGKDIALEQLELYAGSPKYTQKKCIPFRRGGMKK